MSDRIEFTCNGEVVSSDAAPGETLLTVLRERLGLVSVKDGCAPQGQCGCCTVWVDGQPRVACVTPVARIAGRTVTTVDGLPSGVRSAWGDALVATGGSQCGFCTPGIVMRLAAAARDGKDRPADLDRALAAHLCRCTGWQSITEAARLVAATEAGGAAPGGARDLDTAGRRAALEGGDPQLVAVDVPLGAFAFADDSAPRDAWVAVPAPEAPTRDGEFATGVQRVQAAGLGWVVAPSLHEARAAVAKVQGRRTTRSPAAPIPAPAAPSGGAVVVTGWVEPAYLEPDASWCTPGGEPTSPLRNGGAFGGKRHSLAPQAARELANHLDRPVRVLYAREDVVRLGPKRPPVAATSVWADGAVTIEGTVASAAGRVVLAALERSPAYGIATPNNWTAVDLVGPPVSPDLRAFGVAEHALLVEAALTAAGVDRSGLARGRAAAVVLDTCVEVSSGAVAGARVHTGARGIERIEIRVAAGDPLDAVVLRSYCVGAAHMALGWMTAERLSVDPDSGEPLDLTIRSFGVLRARETPRIDVTIVDDPGPARAAASDAVFAAVAAARLPGPAASA